MATEKTVGIIVPSYNQGKYLEAALKSIILNMNYADIQLAVMDGGSTDNSLEIIKRYEKYMSYWQSEPDSGQALAINEGVKHLSGCNYIMWLNSDDVYNDKYAVCKILNYAIQNNYKVCYGKSYFIDEYGKVTGCYPTKRYNKRELGRTCYISQPSCIINREAWMEEEGLNPSLRMCMDYDLWIRLSKKYEFGYLNEFIGNTRIHCETKTTNFQHCHLNEAIYILYKYYGKVPVRWIYAKMMENNENIFLEKLPDKIVKLFLLPVKRKYIEKALTECRYITEKKI